MKYGGLLCNGPINVTREEIDGSIEGKEGEKKSIGEKGGPSCVQLGFHPQQNVVVVVELFGGFFAW